MDRLTDQQQHPDLLPHHVRNIREPLGKDKIDDYFIPNARTDLQDIRDLTENFTVLKKKNTANHFDLNLRVWEHSCYFKSVNVSI